MRASLSSIDRLGLPQNCSREVDFECNQQADLHTNFLCQDLQGVLSATVCPRLIGSPGVSVIAFIAYTSLLLDLYRVRSEFSSGAIHLAVW